MSSKRSGGAGHDLQVNLENYIKAIWNLSQLSDVPDERIPNSDLARVLRVQRPSVTEMLRRLHQEDWVDVVPRLGAKLTKKGERLAQQILRRHRLIEEFLVTTLGLDAVAAHEEAEILEHSVTPRLCDAIDRHLGFPALDTHGMTMSPRPGESRPRWISAGELEPGQRAIVRACPDYDSIAHSKILRAGIKIGTRLRRLPARSGSRGALVFEIDGEAGPQRLSLGQARLVRVELDPRP